MKARTNYIIGFALVTAICVSAFIISPNAGFGGSDDEGSEAIHQIDPNYQPWFQNLWDIPSETASLLFAVQAAIGAIIIGFYIGNERGKRVAQKEMEKLEATQKSAIRQGSEEKAH
jgi:cobalt/nickel transport protein